MEPEPEPDWPELPGYEAMQIPDDNPMTAAKVELGKQLYYDPRLSGDGERSCYGCHLKEHGLTDGKPVAIGAFDKTLTRFSSHHVERRLLRRTLLGRAFGSPGKAGEGRLERRKYGRLRKK